MEGSSLVTLSRLEDLLERERHELRALAEVARQHYFPFHLHDTWGEKKDRHVANPSPLLKATQRDLVRNVFSKWRAPYGMCGAVARRTLLHNAQIHARRRVLVTIDIEQCFPSISNEAVYETISLFVGSTDVAKLLTRLTTVNFHLPQGAPSSPILANMVMQPAFEELRAHAMRIGVCTSSWIDDFAFSGVRAPEMIGRAYVVFGKLGLRVARHKHARIHAIRDEILAAAHTDVTEWELRRLRGLITFVRGVNARQGEALARLAAQKLPEHGRPAPRPPKRFERRPCSCAYGRGMAGREVPRHAA